MTAGAKRERLIETARELFYRHGFNATGIDRILAEAGVAKMTLYKHFRSKEEIIKAVLRRQDEEFRDWLMGYVEREAETPRERLLAIFDAQREWFSQKGFRGCFFLNATAEFSGIAHSVSAVASEHKRLIQAYVRGLASAAGVPSPDRLADRFMLLIDGAIACAQVSSMPAWSQKAKEAATILLDAELQDAPAGTALRAGHPTPI